MSVHDGLPLPQRRRAVVAIALGMTLAVLDGAVANVALPTIARDVQASNAASIWVVNAYQLVITMSLLPLAAVGDAFGHRRVYRAGLVVFTAMSLACALSDSLVSLTVSRIFQGFGAAALMSVNTALVRFTYPRAVLGRGIGINAMVVATSSAIGPSVAAAILSVAPWPWLFAVNIPIGLAALIAARALPQTNRTSQRFDVRSAALNALTFGLLIVGIDGVGHGENWAMVGLELIGAVMAGTALVLRQLNRQSPLLPLDLLRIPIFALSIGTSICSFMAQMMAYVSLPFYLENTLGRSQVETGLLMTPWPLTLAVVAPFAGRLADRFSAGLLGSTGLILLAGGLAALALLPAHPATADIVWRLIMCGLGFGLFQTPNNRAIITSAPHERSGGAGGMLSTARLLGQTTGAALVAVMFSFFPLHGNTTAMAVGACFAAGAALVSGFRLMDFDKPAAE